MCEACGEPHIVRFEGKEDFIKTVCGATDQPILSRASFIKVYDEIMDDLFKDAVNI